MLILYKNVRNVRFVLFTKTSNVCLQVCGRNQLGCSAGHQEVSRCHTYYFNQEQEKLAILNQDDAGTSSHSKAFQVGKTSSDWAIVSKNSIVSTDNSLYYYFKILFSTIVRTSTLYLVVWAMVHLCQLIYCYSSVLLLVSWTQDTHCLHLSFCVGSAAGKQTIFLEAFHRCSVSLELLKVSGVGKLKRDHFNRVRYRKMKGILTFRSEVWGSRSSSVY